MSNRPTDNEFISELESVLELDAGSLQLDKKLAEIEVWDSLAVLSFMAMMDSNYGATVVPSKLVECVTVCDLMVFLP
jgi:acyl carrier protein